MNYILGHKKIAKLGNSYAFSIPKALVDVGILKKGVKYLVKVEVDEECQK